MALQLHVDDIGGKSILVSVVTWDVRWTPELVTWVDLIPTGNATIICPNAMSSYEAVDFPSVLLAIQRPNVASSEAQQAFGDVLASAILVGGYVTAPQVQWLLA